MERITTPGLNFLTNLIAPHLISFPLAEALDKLQKYEDTGLQPEEVAEIVRLKNEGKLNITPCAVGDTVYVIRTRYRKSQWTDSMYDYAIHTSKDRLRLFPETCYVCEKVCTKTDMRFLGKAVFTSKEEALAKIEEAKRNARCSATE